MGLPLEDLFFDRARRDEAVDEAIFLLPVAPHTRQGLLVGGGIPVRVEKNQAVGADQVEATAARFAAEEEDELFAFGVVEFVDELLTLVDVHGPIQTQTAISTMATEFVKDVEGLCVVAYEHDFVVGVLPDASQHAVEDLHFAGVPGFDVAVTAAGVFGDIVIWEVLFTAWEVGS